MPMDWLQYNIEFTDRRIAHHVAVHDLGPALDAAQGANLVRDWWFIRKQPWRLRFRADDPGPAVITDLLTKLAANGRITAWAPAIYEPEERTFGGAAAMDIAHTLFHQDSRYLLARERQPIGSALGVRETSMVLCTALLRAAGLDWYEQGDVWHKVAALRSEPAALPTERTVILSRAIRRLVTVNARELCGSTADAPLAGLAGWIDAFEQAGQALAHLARHGRLERGLRAVLAHHVIFHANRAGLANQEQSTLAALALTVFFPPGEDAVSPPAATHSNTRVHQVTTLSDDRPAVSATQLRSALTDRLRANNTIRTAAVEAAMSSVPREVFLPGVPLERAYADDAVFTKTDATGTGISAASQPTIVATMLEQLAARPGQRVLEIGAGTGYNAGLLGAIVGPSGHVTTIDVDQDIVDGAREHLAAADVRNVAVVLADGALGHPDAAPYDRVIATVGAYDVPAAWLKQLAPGGRLVVPLRLRGTNSRAIAFERTEAGWHSVSSELAVFMPLRGIGDDAQRTLTLTPQGDVTLQVHKDQTVDADALTGVLDTARYEHWTEVLFPPMVPYEWMDLWLSCTLDNALMRMSVQETAAQRGQVTPMFGWGSMATTRGSELAYLTVRPAMPGPDGGKLFEVGVIGHGPAGKGLADLVAGQIRHWDDEFRARTVRFEIPHAPAAPAPALGRFVLERPDHPITVIWE